MISTLPLDDLKKHTKTLYEAVEIIAKRARQINSRRATELQVLDNIEEGEDSFEEIALDIETKLYEKKEKPTRKAIDELMDGKIEVTYPEIEEKPK